MPEPNRFIERRSIYQAFYPGAYGTFSENSSSATTLRSWTSAKSGVKNPKFKSQIAQPLEAGTPYTSSGGTIKQIGTYESVVAGKVWMINPPPPSWRYGFYEKCTGTFLELPVWGWEDASSAESIALENFLADASEKVAPFKGLTFFGELRDTLKMLRSPASALRDGFNSYLRRCHSRTRRARDRPSVDKIISDTWLEYVYGWKPLVADIKSAADAYRQHLARPQYIRVFGKGHTKSVIRRDASLSTIGTYRTVLPVVYDDYEAECTYKGAIQLPITGGVDSAASRVMKLSGFGWEEFLPTAWELLPYSFVVDYFTNISEILGSAHGLTAQYVWKSKATKQTTRRRHAKTLPTTQVVMRVIDTFSSRESIMEIWQYSRTVNPQLRIPNLRLELPGSKWVWVNLFALGNSVRHNLP